MRGLPFNAVKDEILEFLSGINVINRENGVFLIKTFDGRSTGDAFVLLANEDDAVQDRDYLNSRTALVIPQNPDHRSSESQLFLWKNEKILKKALGRHKANLGDRYVEVFRSTGAELHQVNKYSY